MTKRLGIVLFILLFAGSAALAQENAFHFSGYMFGDYYYVAKNHREDIKGENGFWFRRIYFTVDKGLNESFDIRFRLEMNSPGDFTSSNKLTPFVKDAFVRWKKGNNQVLFGISPSPTWEFIESFWGYRSLEKTPLDLQRMGFAREFGIAYRGGPKKVKIHLTAGNGAGESSEINEGKAVSGSVQFHPTDSFVAELYADYNVLPQDVDRATVQGFLGWQKKSGRIGFQYAHQEVSGPVSEINLDVLSFFGVYIINEKWAIIGRFDRMFDPNPEGEKIPYIPFAGTANSNFLLAALDFAVIKNVFLQPNVEFVTYGESDAGRSPGSDIIPRFTVFFRF